MKTESPETEISTTTLSNLQIDIDYVDPTLEELKDQTHARTRESFQRLVSFVAKQPRAARHGQAEIEEEVKSAFPRLHAWGWPEKVVFVDVDDAMLETLSMEQAQELFNERLADASGEPSKPNDRYVLAREQMPKLYACMNPTKEAPIKGATLEALLPEHARVEAEIARIEAAQTQIEGEMAKEIASGELTDERADSLGRKRNKLELIPAKLTQLRAELTQIDETIKIVFEQRYTAFVKRTNNAGAAEREKLYNAILPFLALDDSTKHAVRHFVDNSVGTRTHLAHRVATIRGRIDYVQLNHDYITAAQHLIKAEVQFPA